jgi:hypothetical protein
MDGWESVQEEAPPIMNFSKSNHRSESGSGFWQLQLDRDLVDTISAIYPEWFQNNMAEGGSPSTPRESPPKAVIDTSPLHIDQNKECKPSFITISNIL